jgi:hypothetical protein
MESNKRYTICKEFFKVLKSSFEKFVTSEGSPEFCTNPHLSTCSQFEFRSFEDYLLE